jgi:hypothetical protein
MTNMTRGREAAMHGASEGLLPILITAAVAAISQFAGGEVPNQVRVRSSRMWPLGSQK